jgi:hypothetical protein
VHTSTHAGTHTHIYTLSLSLSLSLCRLPSTGVILNVCTDVCVCVCACSHSATLYWPTVRSISCMPMGPWTAPAQATTAASRYASHAPLNPNARSNRQTHSEIKREGGVHAYTYTHAHTHIDTRTHTDTDDDHERVWVDRGARRGAGAPWRLISFQTCRHPPRPRRSTPAAPHASTWPTQPACF